MSAIYDNWERLVAAVLKKQQLWELFHSPSRSPSSLSDASDSGSVSDFTSSFKDRALSPPKLVLFSDFRPAFDVKDAHRVSLRFLGQGTRGSVYSATMDNGVTIALKRLKSGMVSKLDFKRQMDIVGNVSNEYVAPLRAYYSSEDERVLFYDYYAEGSVYALLHGQEGKRQAQVGWGTRLRIAVGAARGLAQIHAQNGGGLVHGKIRSSNIFLNPHQFGCVSDLGLANLEDGILKPEGLYSPEVKNDKIAQASDVYSFGVLLLELLTRKSRDLVKLVGSSKSKERAEEIFDADLLQDLTIRNDMIKLLQIGIQCVNKSTSKRPKMFEVVKMLEEIFQINPRNSVSMEKYLVFIEDTNCTFDLEDILQADTKVFGVKVLGVGKVAVSYKAGLANGDTIMVKRLTSVVDSMSEFYEIMKIYGRMRHENVSPLMAYHVSVTEVVLVYCYYKQGSVSALLHGNRDGSRRMPLSWRTRLKIAVGAAKGIAYMHSYGAGDFVHGNIKSSNIFLDGLKYGIISEFSLAELVGPINLKGWPDWRVHYAPEVKHTRDLSQASDVYSFGIMLLELVTGRPAEGATDAGQVISIIDWVQSIVHGEEKHKVFDSELLMHTSNKEEAMSLFLQIALECLSPIPEYRPRMPQVLSRLEDISSMESTSEDGFQGDRDPSGESILQALLEDMLPQCIEFC